MVWAYIINTRQIHWLSMINNEPVQYLQIVSFFFEGLLTVDKIYTT